MAAVMYDEHRELVIQLTLTEKSAAWHYTVQIGVGKDESFTPALPGFEEAFDKNDDIVEASQTMLYRARAMIDQYLG